MRIFLAFIMAFIVLVQPCFGQLDNFQNLGFETEAADSLSTKAFWRANEGTQVKSNFRDLNKRDNPCVEIFGTYTDKNAGYIYQQHPVETTDFLKLRISASLKSERVENGQGYIYCYTKRKHQYLQYKRLEEQAMEGTENWKTVSMDFWVVPQVDMIRIGAVLNGEGRLWIDDFKIEVLPPERCELTAERKAFMKECMGLISEYSLFREKIDTSALMEHWKDFSSCAEDRDGVYEGLRVILGMIDNHSRHWSKRTVEQWSNTSSNERYQLKLATGYRIDEQLAYISMPSLGSGDEKTKTLFADHLQHLIDSLDHPKLKGWVLDLRENDGGNCWPMLAGIGPILGEGVCGYFKERENYYGWSYKKGGSYNGSYPQLQVSRKPYQPHSKSAPVAVLTGPGTTSSGEIVAVAFKNRPLSKSFGQKTGGYSTGVNNYELSDGSQLLLTGSVYVDRAKNAYPDGVEPDVAVSTAGRIAGDPVLEAAISWLENLKK